jgi:hypothetical protein
MRLARALAAVAFVAAAAVPARADECVRVVVDYDAPNTHCTTAATNDTVADVLAQRAKETHNPQPRYSSSGFLCAIDGKPDTGCGDHDTEPYWSIWYWQSGRWVYSSQGVTTLVVADRDHDGHPDPFGFRFTPFEEKRQPRANPSYATPNPTPTSVSGSPAPHVTSAPPAPSATARTRTSTPAAVPTTRNPTPTSVSGTPGRSIGDDSGLVPREPPAPSSAADRSGEDGGMPVATIVAVVAIATLGGAGAWKARRT